ncbi:MULTISPECIES: hypothetical protein [Pantoea]|uniref:hypothetical protein n=1 Tax=Pantoea TaxID=53335 RepID=UPI0002EE4436|nr:MULTISPECIES: hypothetical protein [Pantoea]ASN15737.1 hypothetical protein B7764_11180 [Pantoea ananatis]MDC7863865.1 hypothetical protein [Pantoea ananatis]MDI3367304.1 hypothetical protein [Pantoea sp. V108_6]MDI6535646.1 hypothetical protein [Pantoea ananatis]MDN4125824.1 hypothetical protein [Pantoea ananatis]
MAEAVVRRLRVEGAEEGRQPEEVVALKPVLAVEAVVVDDDRAAAVARRNPDLAAAVRRR